jgi:hypothetical protein
MKTLIKGIAQVIALDQVFPTGKTVKLSIVGENGNFLKDSAGAEIKDISLTYTAPSYQTSLILSQDEPEQPIRLFFYSTDTQISDDYYPQSALLKAAAGNLDNIGIEVVSPDYFINYMLAASSKLDIAYQNAVTQYIKDKNGIRSFITAAQNTLENELDMFITIRNGIVETKDNYFEQFNIHLWQFQVKRPPIVDITAFKLQFAGTLIVDVPKELITINKDFGIVEFLPHPAGSAGLYNILLSNAGAIGISLFGGSIYNRVPEMFQLTYSAGLFGPDSDPIEKEGLRQAVARRAYIDLINYIDPRIREQSASESIDGASSSKGGNVDKLIDRLIKEEDKYVLKLQRKYGSNTAMVVM